MGDIPLEVPKLPERTYFPSFLEPRRPAERAPLAVVQTAYVQGVGTRRMDALPQAIALTGIDKSKVSRVCKELDEAVTTLRTRPLEHDYPYVWLDEVYLKTSVNHRIVKRAFEIAIGVRDNVERDVQGFALGPTRRRTSWHTWPSHRPTGLGSTRQTPSSESSRTSEDAPM
jgi:transposase-like protein